ncbi:MAG TPA: vitamin K epoxide reductase family protein [Gemmatimonadales bacterium]|nr:vitamin K epoxide reductase family protein [Gemmatimonadales bacterium]
MTRARMGAALLSLLGLFIALYLYLYKIGKIGSLACGSGGCETVQLSAQSRFLGVDVALIGVVGYGVLLLLALLSLQPRFAGPAWPSRLLAVLAGGAVLFTVYLTGLELFVIHAICRYCVASAVVILLLFLLAARDLRRSAPPAT